MSTPLYLCVHVPEFPAQARLRHRATQRRAAVVVLDGEPPLQQVCSATREATRLGVTHGTTHAELDSFPGVVAMRRSLPEERTACTALLSLAGSFTPRTQMLRGNPTACTLVLDITGTASVFGPPRQIAQRVSKAVEELGLFPRMAVSSNFHAAVCAAPYAGKEAILIARGREQQALGKLPLAALGLTTEQSETFDLWGLRTVAELAALPEMETVVRLGQEGKRLRLLARGEHPNLLVPEEDALVLEEHVEFDAPVDLLESLLFVLSPMLHQLVLRAAAHALALAAVTVRLQLDGAAATDDTATAAAPGEFTRTIKPALPLMDHAVLLKLLHLDLQAHPPGAAVIAVHLSAEPGDSSKVQFGLFSPQSPEPARLDVTLARIAALVGEDRVGSPRLRDTHQPDGFVMERFVSHEPARQTHAPTAANTVALRRLRPSVPLRMWLQTGRPSAFLFEGRRYDVSEAYGPWRRSGGWWSQEVWSREEWDIHAANDGGEILLAVVAHDLLQKQWSLEALYD